MAVETEDPGREGADLRRGGLDAVEVGVEGLPERVLPGRSADPHLVEGEFDGVVEGEVPGSREDVDGTHAARIPSSRRVVVDV